MRQNISKILTGAICAGLIGFLFSAHAEKGAAILMRASTASPRTIINVEKMEASRNLYKAYNAAEAGSYAQKMVMANIGEDWAKTYAESEGWNPVWVKPANYSRLQGIDQIWIRPDGRMQVIEVKAGSSTLNTLKSGVVQGSPDYSVEVAKNTICSPTAIDSEKSANELFLNFAKEGRVDYSVVRVSSSDGIATGVKIEKSFSSTAESMSKAEAAISELQNKRLVGIPKTGTAAQLGALGKVFVVVGAAGSTYQIYQGANQIAHGKIVEGSFNVAGGGATAGGCVALWVGETALASELFPAAMALDSSRNIYIGIKQHDNEQLSIGAVKGAATVALTIGIGTLNPIVITVSGVTYAGAVVYENRQAISGAVTVASREVRGGLNNFAWTVYDYTPEAVKNNGLFQKSVSWFHGF